MRVQSLHIYPLKGGAAVDVSEAAVQTYGFLHDRCWIPIDPDGKPIKQWALPQLARVRVELAPTGILLSATGQKDIYLATPDETAPLSVVRIKKKEFPAYEATTAAHEWFSALLGVPCKLVYKKDAQDGGNPLHLTTTASLEALCRRMGTIVPMNRFRPNIVIDGGEPWMEDSWKNLRIGSIGMEISKPCARCEVIATDQDSGDRPEGDNPLAALKTFRMMRQPHMTGALFGQYAVPQKSGVIRAGDAVEILSAQEAPSFISS